MNMIVLSWLIVIILLCSMVVVFIAGIFYHMIKPLLPTDLAPRQRWLVIIICGIVAIGTLVAISLVLR